MLVAYVARDRRSPALLGGSGCPEGQIAATSLAATVHTRRFERGGHRPSGITCSALVHHCILAINRARRRRSTGKIYPPRVSMPSPRPEAPTPTSRGSIRPASAFAGATAGMPPHSSLPSTMWRHASNSRSTTESRPIAAGIIPFWPSARSWRTAANVWRPPAWSWPWPRRASTSWPWSWSATSSIRHLRSSWSAVRRGAVNATGMGPSPVVSSSRATRKFPRSAPWWSVRATIVWVGRPKSSPRSWPRPHHARLVAWTLYVVPAPRASARARDTGWSHSAAKTAFPRTGVVPRGHRSSGAARGHVATRTATRAAVGPWWPAFRAATPFIIEIRGKSSAASAKGGTVTSWAVRGAIEATRTRAWTRTLARTS
mmetsp:Transcript_34361/g.102870  ORF Transcript_34361/g.102870 Transcript_34361/m.102870 type:complete len:372 (-) Transcript_34361:129-1244(-)